MSVLKLKKNKFIVCRQILTRDTFEAWLHEEGTTVFNDVLVNSRIRWFFGRRRAKRTLWRAAKSALCPNSLYADKLENRLDQLSDVIRKLSIAIKRRKYNDLISTDGVRTLVVVPRGIVQSDFYFFLVKELGDSTELSGFWRLSNRILKEISLEAERLLFDHLEKGGQHLVAGAKGIFMGVDKDYRWRLNDMNGHYYYAYSHKPTLDFTNKKDFRTFKREMDEILYGQMVHLKRMDPYRITAIADAFREGDSWQIKQSCGAETFR